MGSERKELMRLLSVHKTRININNYETNSLREWAVNICRSESGKNARLNSKFLELAIRLELSDQSALHQLFENINRWSKGLPEWMNSGIEYMENWKPKEQNYDYQKYYVQPSYNLFNQLPGNKKPTYEPLIPIPFPNVHIKHQAESPHILNSGVRNNNILSDHFENIALAIIPTAKNFLPEELKDQLAETATYIKGQLSELLPEDIKSIFLKAKKIVNQIQNSLKEITAFIAKETTETLALLNAFLYGIISGLISLIQTIMALLSFIIEGLKVKNLASLTFANEVQEKLEIIEDFTDLIRENTGKIFSGIIQTIKNGKTEFIQFFKDVGMKISGLNKYIWAFFSGAVIFEVLLDAATAFLTGGTSMAAKAMGKISRLSTQAEKFAANGIKLAKTAGKNAAESLSALFKWLKKVFEELVEALNNNNFLTYIRLKFKQLLNIEIKPSQPNLLEAWEKVSGRGRRLGQLLKKTDIKFLKRELKKLKIELELHPEKGSYSIDGFFINNKTPAMMPEKAVAIFITDGVKMKIVLREGATTYEFFHEFMHFRHAQQIGLKKYLSLGGYATSGEVIKEKWVFDKIIENKHLMTRSELNHALDYLNKGPYQRSGIDPQKFDFDLSKIPEVIKKIEIHNLIKK